MVMNRHMGKQTTVPNEFSNVVVAHIVADPTMDLLLNESQQDRTAPKLITGCASAISSCAPIDHGYTDALKNYAEVYEKFQAYLSPLNELPEHDYDQVIAMSVPENSHLGCLNDDMVEFVTSVDNISDDDIEGCGYLGWLHH
jgi:hypothetical protein